jgi:3-hydroxyisobutyrate dehydrogenase
MREIGLVGLGRMGVPICANLVRAGHSVRAGDRRPEAAGPAARCGARWVPELARLAAGVDVLITVLPGPGEVRDLMLGPGGVAAALRGGATWIDMTSNSPAAMAEIRDALLDRGVQVLEAPAGGGVAAAQQGTLHLLVGGEAQVVSQHRDLLEILGRVRHVGGYGAGYTVKLLVNLLWFGQAVAVAEALLLGRASGLDLGVLRDALADSAADSRFIRDDLPALFAGDFMRTFGLDRCYEELQTVTELAREHHVPFTVSEAVADLYRQALRRYGAVDGELLAAALLEEQAGLPLRHLLPGEPFGEGRPGPPRVRAGQQAALGLQVGVGVGRVAAGLYGGGRAAMPGEHGGQLREVLLARPGDLDDAVRGRLGGGGVGDHLGDRPGRDDLRPHLGHERDIALGAPVEQLADELVELRGPDDAHRDGAGGPRPLVRDLSRAVPAGERVDVDDRHDDGPLYPGPHAGLLQVAGGRDEELRGRLPFRRRAGGRVDDDLGPGQGRIQPRAGDDVHPGRPGDAETSYPRSARTSAM